MDSTDKKYLTDLAREVRKSLKKAGLKAPFSLTPMHLYTTDSGGWETEIGSFRGYQCTMEIWFDQFTSYKTRKIYYCIYSRKPEGIQRLITAVKPYLGNHLIISNADLSESSDVVQLSKPMSKRSFGMPIFEKYPDVREYFYSIYVMENLGLERDETQRLIERIVEFVVTINDALSKAKFKQDAEDYKAIENRRVVQIHLRRERNSHLVLLRKQLDDYKCGICGFKSDDMYGEYGRNFAEAHHIVPLSKNEKKRTTEIDDLITVCANCHRMLHRMKGQAGDVARLRSIVRKRPGSKG